MHLVADNLYHIYNQGNNQQQIFFERADYVRFLEKYRALVLPHCETLAYVLMPNHFHFEVDITARSVRKVKLGNIELTAVSNGFRLLLSEFAHEINDKYQRSGSLFRQKTKAKILVDADDSYGTTCFHYLHQNPMAAGLVRKMEDWEFSSFRDYLHLRRGTLCNQTLASQYLRFTPELFYRESYGVIPEERIKKLHLD